MNICETSLGFEIKSEKFIGFFGGVNSSYENLKKEYPQYQFAKIKQIHSDIVLETTNADSELREGDAHISNQKKLALCVATADCIPILIFCNLTGRVAAIHAGWKGVANRIVIKTIQNLMASGSRNQSLEFLIGPHIQKQSFEIQKDVLNLLLTSQDRAMDLKAEFVRELNETKYLLDLNYLLKLQISEKDIPSENVNSLYLDTKTDLRFHSYRREREKAGRQISWIVAI